MSKLALKIGLGIFCAGAVAGASYVAYLHKDEIEKEVHKAKDKAEKELDKAKLLAEESVAHFTNVLEEKLDDIKHPKFNGIKAPQVVYHAGSLDDLKEEDIKKFVDTVLDLDKLKEQDDLGDLDVAYEPIDEILEQK